MNESLVNQTIKMEDNMTKIAAFFDIDGTIYREETHYRSL